MNETEGKKPPAEEKRMEKEERPIRGFVFTCSNKSEAECFERNLFGTDRVYGPIVIRIRSGDLLFLENIDTDILYGVFRATSDGGFKIVPEAWNGRYPYQVKVEVILHMATTSDITSIQIV